MVEMEIKNRRDELDESPCFFANVGCIPISKWTLAEELPFHQSGIEAFRCSLYIYTYSIVFRMELRNCIISWVSYCWFLYKRIWQSLLIGSVSSIVLSRLRVQGKSLWSVSVFLFYKCSFHGIFWGDNTYTHALSMKFVRSKNLTLG